MLIRVESWLKERPFTFWDEGRSPVPVPVPEIGGTSVRVAGVGVEDEDGGG